MSIYSFNPATSLTVGTDIPLGEEGLLYTVKEIKTEANGDITTIVHNDFSSFRSHRDGFPLTFQSDDLVWSDLQVADL